MAKNLLLDTGFWIALYESRDNHHEAALLVADFLDFYNLVLPWPCLYETLNSAFVKKNQWLVSFSSYANRANTVYLHDETYRSHALEQVFRNRRHQSLSLVDKVLMLALEDPNTKIDAVVTFDKRHFRDFCYSRQIELLPG